jgi:hypothetical protein
MPDDRRSRISFTLHYPDRGFRDGFVFGNGTFINPFIRENDQLIEKLLPPA